MGGHNRPYPSLGWVGVDCERDCLEEQLAGFCVGTVPGIKSLRSSEPIRGQSSLGHVRCACRLALVILRSDMRRV